MKANDSNSNGSRSINIDTDSLAFAIHSLAIQPDCLHQTEFCFVSSPHAQQGGLRCVLDDFQFGMNACACVKVFGNGEITHRWNCNWWIFPNPDAEGPTGNRATATNTAVAGLTSNNISRTTTTTFWQDKVVKMKLTLETYSKASV